MSDAVNGSAAAGSVDLDRILFDGKLSGPRPRPGTVSRSSLIERVAVSSGRVVGVIAPAGYGKSTMLAEWAAIERRAVAWVSLDGADDDPAVLLRLLATACSRVAPHVGAIVADMRDVGGLALSRSAPLLAAALAATEIPFVLFVDDVHLAGSPSCADALGVVLGGIPHGCQVVLAGRHAQPYFARLRASGQLVEVGAEDLRVDVIGARRIFDDAGVVDVSDDRLVAAVERCEGWPAGVFLCALIARDSGERALPASGDDRFIADYLYRECFERLPDDMQRFLRRTAVLEQLSGPLCDAVLDVADSQRRLRELEALNLFLIPLDRTRGWYRYHTLFREFLRAELARVVGERVTELHLRAASWCEANGLPAVAIEHLLVAEDQAHAVRLVAATALEMYQVGQVGVVDRWMSALGREAVGSSPPLAVLACWKSLLLAEVAEAQRLADVLERLQDSGGSEKDARDFESARAMIRAAMCARGAQVALDDAAFALAAEPPWSEVRNQAVYLYGSALLLVGDVMGARAAFTEATAGAVVGSPGSVALCAAELAVLAIDDEDWSGAARYAADALRIVDANRMEGYATSALAFAVAARVAVRDGDTVTVERLLAKGMRARVLCTQVLPFLALRVRIQLAKAYAARGERAAAMALAREMDELLRVGPDVGVLAREVARLRRELRTLPGATGAVPLSPAELRVLPYLQTHLTLEEVGRRLLVARSTISSQVASIYRKLGATSRADAVRRATEIGLLGD